MPEPCPTPRVEARLHAVEVRVEERDRRYEERFTAQEKATVLALATFPTKQDITGLIERVTRAEGARGGVLGLLTLLLAFAALVVSVLALMRVG